jgi:hypothetical protein
MMRVGRACELLACKGKSDKLCVGAIFFRQNFYVDLPDLKGR